MLLTLPRLDGIPPVIHPARPPVRQVLMAKMMLNAKMIDKEVRRLRGTLTTEALGTIVESGWARAIGGDFRFKTFSVDLALAMRSDGQVFDPNDREDPQWSLRFQVSSQPYWLHVGRTLEAMEQAVPGIGTWILDVLYDGLCWFGHPATPEAFYQAMEWLHWTEGSEAAQIEMIVEDGGSAADVVKEADIFRGIPAWAYKPERQNDACRARIVKQAGGLGERFASVFAAAKSLSDTLRCADHEHRPVELGEYGTYFLPPFAVGWSDDDRLGQIADDLFRYAQEGDCSEGVGLDLAVTESSLDLALRSARTTRGVYAAVDALAVALDECDTAMGEQKDANSLSAPA